MSSVVAVEQSYGSWKSPWQSDLIGSAVVRLSQPAIDSGNVFWLEGRPAEGGRIVLVCRKPDGTVFDVTPAGFNVRSRVHEYGGGAYIVRDSTVYFSNFADNAIWRQDIGKAPEKVVELGDCRFADFDLDTRHNRLIVVKEQHADGGEPINSLDYVMLDGSGRTEPLLMGSDFFSSPRVSPDGRLISWMSWNHPNMPWDESTLWTANIGASDGFLTNIQKVAGGQGESVSQPSWAPDGTLFFVSDKQNGWWNLHASYSGLVECVLEMDAEFDYPHWIFGMSTFAHTEQDVLLCALNQRGVWKLASVNSQTKEIRWIETGLSDLSYVCSDGKQAVFLGGSPTQSSSVWLMDLKDEKPVKLKHSFDLQIAAEYISLPRAIEFDTTNGDKAYAFFYAPANKDFAGPRNSAPPLIVKSHGGPTAGTGTTLSPSIQFWTSRGFAIVDVNYRGSTGYGRAYREKLNGNWGIVDVDDCENAARFLAAQGMVDPGKLCISGGSAGGYTTLCALTFRDTFKAGASYYGIGDLEALAKDTHKFESRYEDRLVGPYPEAREIYVARSPLHFATGIKCPVAFFQGLEDKVVPPSQSEGMVSALRTNNIPVLYMTFEGEQHGFRKSESIKRCLDAELQFYCRIFGIRRDDFAERLQIENFTEPKLEV